MQGAGGSFPQTVGYFNIQALLNALRSLDGQPNLYGTTDSPVYDFALTLPQFNAVNSYAVRETTTGGYLEAAFAGNNWNGNLGVRVVHTHTSASTAVNQIESVTVDNPSNPTDPATVVYSDATPTSSSGSYTQALPSLNFTYRFRPNLQLRFGASETIARPQLDQLAATRTDDSLNRDYRVDYAGNSELKPIRAYSLDLSLEWYYQPKSALTLAIFGKDIKDFITTQVLNDVDIGVQGYFNGSTTPVPVLYTVSQPINGDNSYVKGIEFSFTHITASGFGVHGQYTRTWSNSWVDGQYVGELEGVSSNSGSLGILYENALLSANINWDYDGPSVAQTFTEVDGWKAYNDAFSWVTRRCPTSSCRAALYGGQNLSTRSSATSRTVRTRCGLRHGRHRQQRGGQLPRLRAQLHFRRELPVLKMPTRPATVHERALPLAAARGRVSPWLAYALMTTLMGRAGAFTSVPMSTASGHDLCRLGTHHDRPRGLGPAPLGTSAAAGRTLACPRACDRDPGGGGADPAVPRRDLRSHLPDLPDHLALPGHHDPAQPCAAQGAHRPAGGRRHRAGGAVAAAVRLHPRGARAPGDLVPSGTSNHGGLGLQRTSSKNSPTGR
jgi:hypothetical protein